VQAPPDPLTAMPTYYPEGNVPQAGDSHKRTLQKINGRLYQLVVATLGFLTPDSDCAPNAGDTVQRSLWKINAIVNALTIGGGLSVIGSGATSPEGVVTGLANGANAKHVYFEVSGGVIVRLWVFNGVVGANTGWI